MEKNTMTQQMKKPDTFTTPVIAGRRITLDNSLSELWGIELGDKVTVKIITVYKKVTEA